MPDSLALAWLMLPLGAALGWYLARRWPRPHEQGTGGNPEYLTGLTHLVNQDPDQAIAASRRSLAVCLASASVHAWSFGGVAGTTTWNEHGPRSRRSRRADSRCPPARVWFATTR